MKIVTAYDPKPIPIRSFDWTAVDADTYEGGMPIGYGRTELEAIADLEESILLADPRHDSLDGHCYEGCPCLIKGVA